MESSCRQDWRIEEDTALREPLEPPRVWERVLVTRADWRRKAGLPENDDLPEEVREACRRLAERRVSWRSTAGEVKDDRS